MDPSQQSFSSLFAYSQTPDPVFAPPFEYNSGNMVLALADLKSAQANLIQFSESIPQKDLLTLFLP